MLNPVADWVYGIGKNCFLVAFLSFKGEADFGLLCRKDQTTKMILYAQNFCNYSRNSQFRTTESDRFLLIRDNPLWATGPDRPGSDSG